MEKFKASNGVQVSRNCMGELEMDGESLRGCDFLLRFEEEALKEYFLAERDEELGRWRWPENPDYVVYLVGDNTVDVLRERSINDAFRGPGRQQSISRGKAAGWGQDSAKNFYAAARAYFAAHPVSKPWHDAKPGEVWELTDKNATVAAVVDSMRQFNTGKGRCDLDCPDIIGARRIYPEVSDA